MNPLKWLTGKTNPDSATDQSQGEQQSPKRNAWCSFCRKSYRDVGPLVEGPGEIFVCGECIGLCQSILDQERRRRSNSGSERCRLFDLAHGRSGDKGNHANIGIACRDHAAYAYLEKSLTAEVVAGYFHKLNPTRVVRYELPNLLAFNFVLYDVLDGGASRSLRIDSQGKTMALQLLELEVPKPEKT
jgi:ClpX C4-type zinc finger